MPPKQKEQKKQKKQMDAQQIKKKREELWKIMDMAKGNDDVLNNIDASKQPSEELGNALENILKAAIDYTKIQSEQKAILQKQQADQKRRIEKERKKEQQRQKQQQRRKEEERRIEQQKKKQAKIALFNKESEQATAKIKQFEQQINKLAETKPSEQSFESVLLFIEKKRQQFGKLEEKRKSQHTKLQAAKELGNEVALNFPIDPDLPDIAERISREISALYLLQEQAYEKARQTKTQAIRQDSPAAEIPIDYRIYNPANFYQLQMSKLYQQSLSKIQALPVQQRGEERAKVQTLFGKLKSQQKFINELKILIELYQVEEQVLMQNKFDLQRYKQLLARKAQIMRQNGGGQQFDRIDDELNNMTSKLNTGAFLMPFKYPLDLLVKAKDHLVREYVQKQINQLQQNIKQQQNATKRLQETWTELKAKLQAKREEKKGAQQTLEEFLQDKKESLEKALQELPRNKQEKDSIELINREQIQALYLQKRDHEKVNKTSEILQGRRQKRAALQKEYEQLHVMFLNTPLDMEEYLTFTPPVQDVQVQSSQEEQMVRLLKICEQIQYRKAHEGKSEQHSGLGRYSSIII